MTTEHKEIRRGRVLTALCAFFLPCALMLAVFAALGIYPFGEKTLLILDMNSEYIDYYAQMHESLRTGGSLLRSWNMGMGLNMLGLIAFYAASPLNLIILLLPLEWMTEAVLAVTLVKIGLTGLLFSFYTDYVLERRGVFAVGFAAAYALCGYNVVYASNLMWLDGVAFLPLVQLGVERMLRERKHGLLLFSLIYVFFTSYYIGYMVGVFSFLYLTAACLARPLPLRDYLHRVGRMLGVAALAAGCCAFLLLPAFLGLRNGQSELWSLSPSLTLEKSFLRILSRLLPGAYDTPTDAGYPNIYCTIPAALCCVLFFTQKGIPRREKIVYGGFLGLLLLSFSCELLDLAWHAFEEPTWYPARYSFVFSFLVIYLAMRAAKDIRSVSPAAVVGAATLLLVLLLEVMAARYRQVNFVNLVTAAILLLVWGALCLLYRKSGRRALAVAALVILCAEAWVNALVTGRGLDEQFHYKERAEFVRFRTDYGRAVAAVTEPEGAHRTEIVRQRSANGGMALGYNGISHYSTTTDQALNAFLCSLGYNRGTANELRFTKNTPLTNGLLGVRFVLSEEKNGAGYIEVTRFEEIIVYENRCAFPLAFWSAGQLGEPREYDNPFELQNDWVAQLGMEQVPFEPVVEVERQLNNLVREDHNGYISYLKYAPQEDAGVEYWIGNPQGKEIYAYFPVWNRKFSDGKVYVDGKFLQSDLKYRNNAIAPLGNSDNVLLRLAIEKDTTCIEDEIIYNLDLDSAIQAAQEAKRHAVTFSRFKDTELSGIIDAPEAGVVYTTIPADGGWRVWIDGERTEPQTFQGVFLVLPVSAGTHTIEMRYLPPGFQAGCVISVFFIVAITAMALKIVILQKIKQK